VTYFILGFVVIVLYIVLLYNNLIAKKNSVENLFSGVEVQLKKRYDLIPSLVNIVSSYTDYEKELLVNITKLREQIINSSDMDKIVSKANVLGSEIGKLLVKIEAYPDLKASENYLHFQKTLSNVEEEISAARRAFNQAINDYNNAVEQFPSNIIANKMNYKRKKSFQTDNPIERINIKIDL
jgi:LemA protein